MKYFLDEVTPNYMRCSPIGCSAIYKEVRNITSEDMRCAIGGCPSIYEEKDVTPKDMRCAIGACPEIHQTSDSYLIVGEVVNPSEVGLEGKVGKGEVLIRIPRELIDKKEK